MARIKRLFYIAILNIILSGATTLIVLHFWERAHSDKAAQITVVVVGQSQSNLPMATLQTGMPEEQATSLSVSMPESTLLPSDTPLFLVEYVVKKGDTLSKIALAFDVSLEEIMRANGLTDPDLITEGQVLYIPTAPLPTLTPSPSPASPATFTPLSRTATRAVSPTPAQSGEPPTPRIESILGAGNPDMERVRITRTGVGELTLAGWRLEDSDGNFYVFPNLILNEGGSVTVHTARGADTVTDLYWGLTTPVWRRGETAILRDETGAERARYQIP